MIANQCQVNLFLSLVSLRAHQLLCSFVAFGSEKQVRERRDLLSSQWEQCQQCSTHAKRKSCSQQVPSHLLILCALCSWVLTFFKPLSPHRFSSWLLFFMGQFPFFEKPLQNSPRLCMSLLSLLALGFILPIRDLGRNPKAVGVGARAAEWMWSQDNFQEPAHHVGFRDQARVVRPGVASRAVLLSINTSSQLFRVSAFLFPWDSLFQRSSVYFCRSVLEN